MSVVFFVFFFLHNDCIAWNIAREYIMIYFGDAAAAPFFLFGIFKSTLLNGKVILRNFFFCFPQKYILKRHEGE